ncbi:MAG: S-methyl-5-thioribose-1-phosphate isomerase [Candidatus ainarchaeum sp.]|nr:S-methyl-5-thioribose-1-phosphate isomerase [Candidatus ainarchaeum sp.]
MDIVKKTVQDIKSLKIQGASNVRKKAVDALMKASTNSKLNNPLEFRKEFLTNSELLFYARPTEPELRTAIRIFKKSIAQKDLTVKQMKEKLQKTDYDYEASRKKAKELIVMHGAKLIPKNSTILTICHSSTVVDILIKAKKNIKQVYCLETRPLYQGRITAKELSDAGLNVTLLVDNAASTVLKKCDFFFSGADAILADGDVINKIGTNQISYACKRYDTKHYVCASTHKFEAVTFFGEQEPIEQRAVKEIFEKKAKFSILNPAFDRTDSSTIEGIITEKGVFGPKQLASILYAELNLASYESEFLKL